MKTVQQQPKEQLTAKIEVILPLVGAIAILVTLIALGRQYTKDCVERGKEVDQCWDKGLAIAGMGAGGPISAGVVFGYLIGTANKEKEKQERFEEGYWTLNPELHSKENQ